MNQIQLPVLANIGDEWRFDWFHDSRGRPGTGLHLYLGEHKGDTRPLFHWSSQSSNGQEPYATSYFVVKHTQFVQWYLHVWQQTQNILLWRKLYMIPQQNILCIANKVHQVPEHLYTQVLHYLESRLIRYISTLQLKLPIPLCLERIVTEYIVMFNGWQVWP